MTYLPDETFRSYAAGGTWPVRHASISGGGVALSLPDTADLQNLYIRHAAGIEETLQGQVTVFSTPGRADQLLALTLRFEGLPQLRLLLWVSRNRPILDALMEGQPLTLCSEAGFDALVEHSSHGEQVRLDLDLNWTPLHDAARQRRSLCRTPSGWRVRLPNVPDGGPEGLIEARRFADDAAYREHIARLAEQPDPVAWQQDETRTITLTGLIMSRPGNDPDADRLWAEPSGDSEPIEISEDRARFCWASYELAAAREASKAGRVPPLPNTPLVSAWRVMDGDAKPVPLIVFLVAFTYPSEERTQHVHERLCTDVFEKAAAMYLTRLRVTEPETGEHSWLILALASDHATKDALVRFDWESDGVSITPRIGEGMVVNLVRRHTGIEDAELGVQALPAMLGPT